MSDDRPPYIVDDATIELLEVALNCMVQLGEAQLDEEARDNLLVIAEELAKRFNISYIDVEETDQGEVIYKPKGGIFPGDHDDSTTSVE